MLHIWGEEKCIRAVVGKAEEKRQVGRSRYRWEKNITMALK
jgi:hypothetical protein